MAPRRRLLRPCCTLDGSRDLVIGLAKGRVPPLVQHVLEQRLDRADEAALVTLRAALDAIASRRVPVAGNGGSR
jgi:hypothetical protein